MKIIDRHSEGFNFSIDMEPKELIAEIVQHGTASDLIKFLDSIVVALYESGFDDISEFVKETVDSLGE